MKNKFESFPKISGTLLSLSVVVLVSTGCCTSNPKPEPVHSRGWIGGEYREVGKVPAELKKNQKTAILITDLSTNTPAYAAGLREGDLILEMNHQPLLHLRAFRELVDRSQPGAVVPIKAWHAAQPMEYQVRVGRETYTHNGIFMIGLPPVVHELDLWPVGGFSLGVAGFKPEPADERKELQSTEVTYLKSCDGKNYEAEDEGWKVWLVILQAQSRKRIKSQEIVLGP